MGLFGKKKLSKEAVPSKKVNCVGDRLDRLDANGCLPFGWATHNKQYIDMIEDDMWPFRNAIVNAETDVEMYAALKSFLLYLQDGKTHYNEMGECVGKYFEEYICKSCEAEQCREAYRKLEDKLLRQK